MSTTSQYMGFPISTIGVDSGLDWETNLNAALSIIDQHDHSSGKGVQINPAGLNINADLPFNSNNATLLRATRFSPQANPISNSGSDVGELYVSGNELYYNDATGGNQVQITSNGSVNATSSGISSGTASAAFSSGVLLVKSSSTSYGNVALQSVLLSNSGSLTNQLTLKAPTLSGSYNVTLPALPSSQSFVAIDTSGNLSGLASVSQGLTGSNLAENTVERTNLVSVGQIVSGSSGSFSSNSTSLTTVTNLSVSITTSGRPVMVMLQSDPTDANSLNAAQIEVFNSSSNPKGWLAIARSDGVTGVFVGYYQLLSNAPGAGMFYTPPCMLDPVLAGTYTYSVAVAANTTSDFIFVKYIQLVVYEL